MEIRRDHRSQKEYPISGQNQTSKLVLKLISSIYYVIRRGIS